MGWYWFLLAGLATWRVTHLLNAEDGPWRIFVRLRQAAGDGFWGELLDCFYCLSLWVAAPIGVWLGRSWLERALLVPALSAAAIVVERFTARDEMPLYQEDEDGVLRTESDTGSDTGIKSTSDDKPDDNPKA